jgi:hypothetical protein
VASLAVVAGAVALGGSIDRRLMQALAASLLLAVLIVTGVRRLLGHSNRAAGRPAGQAGLALWSFIVATGHGAGAMLVPALMPLCAGSAPSTAARSLGLALAAVGIHLAAMVSASGVAAALACGLMRRLQSRICPSWRKRAFSLGTSRSCRSTPASTDIAAAVPADSPRIMNVGSMRNDE